jgi:hypothetical protein
MWLIPESHSFTMNSSHKNLRTRISKKVLHDAIWFLLKETKNNVYKNNPNCG